MTGVLEITILGCGSSGGVPRADGDWGACDPANPKNHRSRCSMLVRRKGDGGPEQETTVVVDTSPDFRLQSARAGIKRIDALLLTHDHADQVHGLDDVRAFFLRARGQRIHTHMDATTHATMMQRFNYIFEGDAGYPAICEAKRLPPHGVGFSIDGPSGPIPVVTFDQDHGGVRSVGYRFGGVAYSSDLVDLDDAAFEALADLDVWIVDALRYRPHPSHAHVERTLSWIERAKPRRAILTNMHIDLDHAKLSSELPPGVEAAYDGLRLEHQLGAGFP
jgi:phosphoribosyl 1,2-cyclic phosphate phosphodiesterase